MEVCIQCIVCTTHTHLRFMSVEMKKIPSEMEVTPRYKLLTLLTLLIPLLWLTLLTWFKVLTLLPLFTISTLLKLLYTA